MTRYCKTCFRDLASDDAVCDHCVATARSTSSPRGAALIIGVAGIAAVVAGVVTLNMRYCQLGAAALAVAVVIHVVRTLR